MLAIAAADVANIGDSRAFLSTNGVRATAMKLRDGKGKWILRQLVDRHVPRALIDRPKMGFGIPLDQWLRGPLRDWAEALLDEGRLKREGYFHPAPIRSAWLRHQRGEASYGYRLWSVLMFQAWLRGQASTGSLMASDAQLAHG